MTFAEQRKRELAMNQEALNLIDCAKADLLTAFNLMRHHGAISTIGDALKEIRLAEVMLQACLENR